MHWLIFTFIIVDTNKNKNKQKNTKQQTKTKQQTTVILFAWPEQSAQALASEEQERETMQRMASAHSQRKSGVVDASSAVVSDSNAKPAMLKRAIDCSNESGGNFDDLNKSDKYVALSDTMTLATDDDDDEWQSCESIGADDNTGSAKNVVSVVEASAASGDGLVRARSGRPVFELSILPMKQQARS